jgi:phosphatidylserine decarboxylase
MKKHKRKKKTSLKRPRLKVKIHAEGREIIFSAIALFAILNWVLYSYAAPFLFYGVAGISLVLLLMVINFFRSPLRKNDCEDDRMVFAPADGVIVAIEQVYEPDYFKDERIMVSIFMNIFNVHANWYPIMGKVKRVGQHSGRFMSAYLPKASTENERSMVVVQAHNGQEVMARQIAGAMARRIVTYAQEGQKCCLNQHMGFIKFGSRVDVYLPLGTEILIEHRQKTVGSQTPIARLTSKRKAE